MRPDRWRVCLGLGVASIVLGAATPRPAIDDPEAHLSSTLVSEIVVGPGGPAWWEVTKAGRKVYVLGVLWSYPPKAPWSQRVFEHNLRGAKTVLLPPALSSGAARVVDESLPPVDWSTVPAATRLRIEQAARALGKPVQRYLGRPPLVAGYLLISDYRDSQGLKSEALLAEISRAIVDSRVDARNAAVIPADRYVKALSTATPEAGLACLEGALSEIDAGHEAMSEAVEGWAHGDVAAALKAPRGMELCSFAAPGQSDLRRAAIEAQVAAIAQVLDGEPGARPTSQYMAVTPLRSLLAEDGILDQLRKRGYQVRAPKD